MKIPPKIALVALVCAALPVAARADELSENGLPWGKRASIHLISRNAKGWEIRASYPKFSANTPLTRYASWQLRLGTQSDVRKMAQEFTEFRRTDTDFSRKYEYEAVPTLRFYGPKLISLELGAYADTAGAHPNSWSETRNYGLVNGRPKRLNLGDFFRPNSNYRARIHDKILGKLRENPNAMWVADGMVKSLDANQLNSFVAQPDGLTWIFDPYEMGPYAVGFIQTRLNLNELGPNFRRELLK